MGFQFIPVAEASTESVLAVVKSINKIIINPIIIFLFACAIAYFIYGVAQYFLASDNEEVRKKSKIHMFWGIIGLFIMVAVFGIMRFILSTVGETKIKINNNGDYVVDGTDLADRKIDDHPDSGKSLFEDIEGGISAADQHSDIIIKTDSNGNPIPEPTPSFENPFTKVYVDNPLCWRGFAYSKENTEFKAIQAVKAGARELYMTENKIIDPDENPSYPITFDRKVILDADNKLYHVWWDVRAPIDGGTIKDCNLEEVLPDEVLPDIKNESNKQNPLKGNYVSNANYYRAIGSGVDVTIGRARTIAVNNALIEIARQKGLTNIQSLFTEDIPIGENGEVDVTALSGVTYLEEQYYPKNPPNSKTAEVDYWVAIQFEK